MGAYVTRAIRSRRWRASTLLATLALAMSVTGASAWERTVDPDGPYNPLHCQQGTDHPCIRWPKTASNLSINVDVYLHSSLTSQEVNLTTVALAAMSQWNGIAARNPHLQQTTSTSNDEIYVDAANMNDPDLYAETTTFLDEDTLGDPAVMIERAAMRFNTQIDWNADYDYACTYVPPTIHCSADAHKVVRHEFGHAEGLAHETCDVTAIMVQGEPCSEYHLIKTDDHNGIRSIYGAYP